MIRRCAWGLAFVASACSADTVQWIGGGLTDNWTNLNNWLALNRPDAGDKVRFGGSYARSFSDVNEDFSISSVVFEYDYLVDLPIGRSYTVGGSGWLTLSGGVTNSTNLAQMVTAPIRLANGVSIGTARGYTGSLTLGAIDLGNWALNLNASAGGLVFNGPITGSGSQTQINAYGEGLIRFNAASSWTGELSTNTIVEYASGAALGSTGVRVNLVGGTLRRTTSGTNVLDFRIYGRGTLDVPATLTVTHTGHFVGSGATLAKTGGGTLVLTQALSGIDQVQASGGRLRLQSNTSLADAFVVIASGATVEYARTPDDTLVSLAGGGTLQLDAGGRIQVGAGDTYAGGGRFDGSIQGANARFAKSGIGAFELRGASTYTGGTSVAAGSLLLNNSAGSATGSGPVVVHSNALLGGDGASSGAVTLQELAVIAPSSRDDPGARLGSLAIGGLQMQAGSILQLELGANGTSDLLTVNGDATLNGTLALSRLGNIVLADNLTRRILSTTGTMSGRFQSITGRSQSPTAWFAVRMSPQAIDVVRASPGDASLDGQVDFADLLILARHLGQPAGASWLTGDFNGDGIAGPQDLALAALNYSPSPGSDFDQDWRLARASLVPEPASWGLFAAGWALLALCRRRTRRSPAGTPRCGAAEAGQPRHGGGGLWHWR